MLIRKQFRFESGHVVRGCNSERCKKSMHGHSYVVEVFFRSRTLTPYSMVVDFGDLGKVKSFIDRFDHSFHFWDKEKPSFRTFIVENNQRWVKLPFSPTAESYAIMFLKAIREMTKNQFDNKEAECIAVRVHETSTGYAQSCVEDLKLVNYKMSDIKFSKGTFIS